MVLPAKSRGSPVTGPAAPAAEVSPIYLWKSVPVYIWLAALGTVLLGLFVHFVVRYGFLDNMDEENYLWLSRRILEGRVTAQLPPLELWDHFEVHWRGMHDGQLYTSFFFMWAFLLALGTALHMPWLINPLLAGISIILAYLIARNLYNDRLVANTTALLLAACPFLTFQAGTMMSHLAIAMWCLAAALALTLYWKRPRPHYLLIGGLMLGLAFSTRPLDAMAFALPIGIAIVMTQYRQPARLLRTVVLVAAGGLVGIIPFLAYNFAVTGNVLVTPHQLHGSPLFATSVDVLFEHLPKTLSYLSSWGRWFIPWWVAVLSIVALIVLRGLQAGDRVAIGIILSIVAVYTTYTTMFDVAGPRYHFLVLFPVMLILARVLTTRGWRLAALGIGLVYLSFLRIYYHEGRRMHWDIDEKRSLELVIQQAGLERAIVLVPDGWHFRMYARSLFKNEPDFSGIIYAIDIPESNHKLLAHFPGVPVYRWPSGSREPPGKLTPYQPE